MSAETNAALLARFADALFGQLDGEAASQLVTDDFRPHPWKGFGISDGPEGVHQMASFLRSAFSNVQRSTEDVVASGDRVVMRYVFEADHTGLLLNIPPTGRRIRLPGIFIARVQDGRVAEYWCEEDLLGLMYQLDAIPAEAAQS